MQVIADLQLHSRFARAVSKDMNLPVISSWANKKGINLVATGDWTHPLWFREMAAGLKESGEGVYRLRGEKDSANFLLSTEISSIYSKYGRTRRIHTLIFAPNLKTVEEISKELQKRGANLMSDGRPIVGLSAKEVAEIALTINEKCLIIPAHARTPWFSLYGSESGFDSIEECFEELSSNIYAIETGLSSDPAMNWKVGELANRKVVSFSDAHSPQKLGREATVFDLEKLSFENIRKAIVGDSKNTILYTIEFYPEEGKYHYSGHRKCSVIYSPKEITKMGRVCPVCGKSLTVGVMSRVEALATLEIETESSIDEKGVRWIKDKEGKKTPYVMMVPLLEILSEALDVGVSTKTVLSAYEVLIDRLQSEFNVLFNADIDEIEQIAGERVAEGIKKVRLGDIVIKPGYDGVFGEVKIWRDEKVEETNDIDQRTLF